MQTINRAAQRDILEKLASVYPSMVDVKATWGFDDTRAEGIDANLAYLEEHGLIKCLWIRTTDNRPRCGDAQCTARGIDFLADDGGLSAVLGVVTFKIHDETIKQLIAARIQASELPPEKKTEMLDQLRELPAEATKHLALELLDKAMEGGPAAIQWLGNWLSSL